MGWTIQFELRRRSPLTAHEREQLHHLQEVWRDGWADLDGFGFDLTDAGGVVAAGEVTLPDGGGDDLERLLSALTDLHTEIPQAKIAIEDEHRRIRWDDALEKFTIAPRRPREPRSGRRPMPLPPANFQKIGLEQWVSALNPDLALPPGPPSRWTTLLHVFGPLTYLRVQGATPDHELSDDWVPALLSLYGRPDATGECEHLWWVTPIPSDVSPAELLATLAEDSSQRNAQIRGSAAILLGLLHDPSALPKLMSFLDNDDATVRAGAATGLGYLGDPAAIAALASRPWDENEEVTVARLRAIDQLDGWRDALPRLDRHADHPASRLVRAIGAALDDADPAPLLDLLAEPQSPYSPIAVRALALDADLAATALPRLLTLIREGWPPVAHPAIRTLGLAGEEATESILTLLADSDWRLRMYGAIALQYAPSLSSATEGALRERLTDADVDVAREAALALALAHVPDASIDARLIPSDNALRYGFFERCDELGISQDHAAIAMFLGQAPPTVHPATLDLSSMDSGAVRGLKLWMFALAAPDLAAPLLDRIAQDPAGRHPESTRRRAASALLLTGHAPATLPMVHRILLFHVGSEGDGAPATTLAPHTEDLIAIACFDSDADIRAHALRLLTALGPAATAPYTSLIRRIALHDPARDVRAAAQRLVPQRWGVTTPGQLLAEILVAGRREATPPSRALRELARVDAPLALQVCQLLIRRDDRELARCASVLLGRRVTPITAAHAVTEAIDRLESDEWITREAACDFLGAIPVTSLTPTLLDEAADLLEARADADTDSDVKNAANAALRALGREPTAAARTPGPDTADSEER
jgi:hypothetical protein